MIKLNIKETNKKDLVAGIISLNELYESFLDEHVYQNANCIDLQYEEYLKNLEAQGLSEEEINEELENYEEEGCDYLFGDWVQNKDGNYEINYNGNYGFALSYSNNSLGSNVTVDWSKWSAKCHHTSPCYRMIDGRPCGDLETEGDSVEAYCLPADFYKEFIPITNSIEFIQKA